ncbi:MAG: diguanylate cyclase [Nitrospirae bacterium]|nr:diguanylate cyclase [Nitrospirota bacterium]
MKVLIVDDDKGDVFLIRKLLSKISDEFSIESANSFKEALSCIENSKYEICLFDFRLPGCDGIDLLRAARERGLTSPVIFLTGLEDQEIAVNAMKEGALDYLQKSKLTPELLYQSIKSSIELQKRNEEIKNTRDFLNAVIDGVDEPIIVIDLNYRVILVNRVVREKYPVTANDTETLLCYKVSHCCDKPCDNTNHPCPLSIVYESGRSVKVVHEHYQKDGEMRFVEILASPLRDAEDNIYAVIESTRDITERKLAEMTLEFKANYDVLTGLPNRVSFYDRMAHIMAFTKRQNKMFALMLLDLDRFKEVNDSFGHDIGDTLLKEVAQRLKNCVRESDTVARLGGDEFTIILHCVVDKNSAATVAQKIINSIANPFILNAHECSIGISIGICSYPNDGCDIDTLIKKADIAMYNAKKLGRNTYYLYDHKESH